MVVVHYLPLSTVSHQPVRAYLRPFEIVVACHKRTVLLPAGRTCHHHLVAIPSYPLQVEQSARVVGKQVVITEEIGVQVGSYEGCAVTQSTMFGSLGINEDRVLLTLWYEALKCSVTAHGVVYAVAVGPHVISCINKVIEIVTFEHTGTLGPLSRHAAPQVHIVAKAQVRGHVAGVDALIVGMVEVPLAIVVDKQRPVDVTPHVVRLVYKGSQRTFTGKYVVTAATWRCHHVKQAVPIDDLGSVGNCSRFVCTTDVSR